VIWSGEKTDKIQTKPAYRPTNPLPGLYSEFGSKCRQNSGKFDLDFAWAIGREGKAEGREKG
jgi:hypothetical protein